MRHVLILTSGWGSLLFALGILCPRAMAERPPDFDRDIRPILEQHCFECHGPDKQKSGLRLDSQPSLLRGGDSGVPAIIPGNSRNSHLLKLVASPDPDDAMPPKGKRLAPEQIALLQRWIDAGAHWFDESQSADALADDPAPPAPGITDEHRRFWSFVPPRPVQPPATEDARWPRGAIDRFILARLESRSLHPSPDASASTLIRRLSYDLTGLPPAPEELDAFLSDHSSDAYERVVDRLLASPRFGERMASMWLPLARYAEDQAHQVGSDTKFFYPMAWKYRQWVIDAFNRDLPYDRFILLQLAADQADQADPHYHTAPDDLAALGFIGLGPKYYGRGRLEVMADEWEDRVDTVTRTILALTVACARCHDHKFDPISAQDYHALAGVFASTRMVNKTPDGTVQKTDLQSDKLDPATLHVVEDGDVQDLNLFIRGNVNRKGPPVRRRFLAILSPGEPVSFSQGSGRLELALAIADAENPLTARVIVNRVWGLLFGAYLVPTPSNFGHSGQPPTHPELLDDLAVRFIDNGWSIKWLIREIVLSSTYRQATRAHSAGAAADSANELLWRMNRRRLTIEQWRDTVLFVSGSLESGGGPSLELDDPANLRRTVYARVSRLKLNDLLMQFDYPDANVHSEQRAITNTPLQKLFMLNSPFILEQARAFAARLQTNAPESDEARIDLAYRLLFARAPEPAELRLALQFLQDPDGSPASRWDQYAQVLLLSNEALYVD